MLTCQWISPVWKSAQVCVEYAAGHLCNENLPPTKSLNSFVKNLRHRYWRQQNVAKNKRLERNPSRDRFAVSSPPWTMMICTAATSRGKIFKTFQHSLYQMNFISISFFPHYGSTNYLHCPSCNIIRRNTFPPAVFSMLRRSTFDGGRFFPAVPKWRCFSSESIFRQMLWHSLI